jgi:hypothetical protein
MPSRFPGPPRRGESGRDDERLSRRHRHRSGPPPRLGHRECLARFVVPSRFRRRRRVAFAWPESRARLARRAATRSDPGRTVSRILWPVGSRLPAGDHSSTPPLSKGLQRPTRRRRPFGRGSGRPCRRPIWPCSTWGLACQRRCRCRGALLPHLFTLAPAPEGAVAVSFLCHFPSGCPDRDFPGTLPAGVRTFLPSVGRSLWSGDRLSGPSRRQDTPVSEARPPEGGAVIHG